MPKDEALANMLSVNRLSMRRWREGEDYDGLANALNMSRLADGVDDFLETPGNLKELFDKPKSFDPDRDATIIEREGRIVGLCLVRHEERPNGDIAFIHSVELTPDVRRDGVRRELFLFNERHAKEASCRVTSKPIEKQALLLWANDEPNEWMDIVKVSGYEPVQHVLSMVRPLDDFPEVALPKGFEIRPVPPVKYEVVWSARRTACIGEWDFSEEEWDKRHFEKWMRSEEFQPELWQVAWHGDTIAGMILNFILQSENEGFKRRRGHTEHVFVREQFRRRGLARALLAKSFRVLREHGVEEAALDTEVENPNETVRLYGSMGFKVSKRFTWYRKPL